MRLTNFPKVRAHIGIYVNDITTSAIFQAEEQVFNLF